MKKCILDYLYETAHRFPQKEAFIGAEEQLTFAEMKDIAQSIGTVIGRRNLHNEPVVVWMDKHPKMLAAFLGVMAGGCFYVPLDSEMPMARIEMILQELSAEVMICDENTKVKAKKAGYQGEILQIDKLISCEADESLLGKISEKRLERDPAYIIFTSGSTGIPKGVVTSHGATVSYIKQLIETLHFTENTVFANQTPFYVDACIKEVYATIMLGASTYLMSRELFLFPVKVIDFLNQNKINTICWVASALSMIASLGGLESEVPKYLHTIAFASEVFPIKQLLKWREKLPNADFYNLYGPTEGTGVCCCYQVKENVGEMSSIPIGVPFPNTEILLLDENNKISEKGEEGEICIRSDTLAIGYYNNSEKTEESFIQNPLNKVYPDRIYKTGDIGRYDENGNLCFVSRKDYQIKHMGHRIELGEIEEAVNRIEGINVAACIYDKEKGKIICCYVGNKEKKELTEDLKEWLPRYMMPNQMEQLEEMLYTLNGKVDRLGLAQKYSRKKNSGRK